MCGICGVVSNTLGISEKKLFSNLLFFNQTRGADSTGIFSVRKPGKDEGSELIVDWAKEAVPSSQVLLNKDSNTRKQIEIPGLNALVGHCRFATKGAVNADNAHPFEFSNVVGVHNGTINKVFEGSDKYGTDSEALYALINDKGLEYALNEVESAYSSNTAYALAYYDKDQETMNFVLNDERPLMFTWLYNQTTLMFASEEWMLQAALESSKTLLTPSSHDVIAKGTGLSKPFFTLKKHRLFSVNVRNAADFEFTDIPVKRKVYPVTHYKGGSSHTYNFRDHGYWNDDIPFGESSSAFGTDWLAEIEKEAEKREQTKKVNKTEKIIGWKGNYLTPEAFEGLCKNGCLACGEEIHTPPEDALWIDRNHLVCVDCYQSEEWVREYSKDFKEEQNADC